MSDSDKEEEEEKKSEPISDASNQQVVRSGSHRNLLKQTINNFGHEQKSNLKKKASELQMMKTYKKSQTLTYQNSKSILESMEI